MRSSAWKLIPVILGMLLAIAATGCGGCGAINCDDDDDNNSESEPSLKLELRNNTPYFVHFLHPDETIIYMPPKSAMDIRVTEGSRVTMIISPGQVVSGRVDTPQLFCCDNKCGTVMARWDNGELIGDVYEPTCGGGSCPFVYTHDRRRFVLEGEPLVGALNRGAQRTDAFVLHHLKDQNGRYRVRVATELDEVNYIDALALEVVDHRPGTLVLPDQGGTLHRLDSVVTASRAVDSAGKDRLNELRADDDQVWEGDNRRARLRGKIRDWVDLDFDRPKGASQAVLLVRCRNTRLIQDAYHSYMRDFGPGLPKLMRQTTMWPWYRPTIDSLLRQTGFTLEASIKDGSAFRHAGTLKPVGAAGVRTLVVSVPLPEGDSPQLSVRLAVLPGAWLVDSVRLSFNATADVRGKLIFPRFVHLGKTGQAGRKVGLEALGKVDAEFLDIENGQSLEAEFEIPPRTAGRLRTTVLRISGYYEENERSLKPCIRWRTLISRSTRKNTFAKYVLKRLQWRDVLDQHADRAKVERIR